jgi:hypothetical protein
VTDDTVWQPPSAGGEPSPPAYGEYSRQPAPSAPPPGWTPPPKPGLIPLRPLGLGAILGASFQVLRRNPRPTLGIALLLNGLVTVVSTGIAAWIIFVALSRLLTSSNEDIDEIGAGTIVGVVLATLLPLLLSQLIGALLQGIITLEVARGTVGEKLTLRSLWGLARGRVGALIGWSAIILGCLVLALAVIATLLALLFALGGTAGIVVGVLLGLVALLGAAALQAWLGTRLSMVPSVLVLERLPLLRAVRRSWSLTTGYFWRTLGIQLLAWVILTAAAQVVAAPISALSGIGSVLVNPNGDEQATLAVLMLTTVLSGVVSLVVGSVSVVVLTATTALLYIDIRMRKEGLDLDLARFVEARQVGDASVPDPYLPGKPAAPPVPPTGVAAPMNDSPWA